MLMIAVVLNLLAALGLCAMAVKYYFGPAPADYHGKILTAAKQDIGDAAKQVLSALNQVLGASLFSLAIAISGLSLFGVYQDILWAKILVLVLGLFAGVPFTRAAHRLEKQTGVSTPWKFALMLPVILFIGFVFSIV